MQTRKRAKSITFGKKTKDEPEDKEVLHNAAAIEKPEEKEELPKAEPLREVEKETSGKEEAKDESKTTPESVELNKPVEGKKEDEEPVEVTPKEDFLTDTSPAGIEEETKDEEKESKKEEEESTPEAILSDNLSSVPESVSPPQSEEEKAEEEAPAAPVAVDHNEEQNNEALATPSQSAFSLQGGEESTEANQEEGKKRFGLYFFIVALLSFILGLAAMAAVTYFGLVHISIPKQLPMNFGNFTAAPGTSTQPTVLPTQLPIATVTPTSQPVDLKAYKISLLNGSGISGKAASAQTKLTAAGFTVSSTGNANKSTYTTTQITVKPTVSDGYIVALEKELAKEYKLDKTTKATSTSAQTTDVVVILGSQTAQ